MAFEEEYQDVLQNIEAVIAAVYQQHPDLTDFNVDSALEALGRTYQREKTNPESVPVLPKNELAKQVYQSVRMVCEWRLGHENVVDEEGQPLSTEPLSFDEIQACLKRIRKSLEHWNKESGTRGYLNYVLQFLV